MTFAGMNLWAMLVAGLAGFAFGGVWYWLLAEPWKTAHGFTTETIRAHHGKGASKLPFVIAIAASLLMATVLSGLIGHLGFYTLRGGMISAAVVWAGFVLPTLAVNNTFALRSPRLIVLDGGHWLAVLLLMGAILGVWGV